MPCVGYPSHFSDQLLAELILKSSEAIEVANDPAQQSRAGCAALPLIARRPLASPTALMVHPFAILIQIKVNCEIKKLHSKLVYLAS